MGKTSWQTKKKYNSQHYKRIAVDLDKDLVDAFREKCKAAGLSQSEVIRTAIERWLEE